MKYEQIFIKSEADLPKINGSYFVAEKEENNKYIFLCAFECNAVMSKLWMRDIDWYLQPIPEQKEVQSEVSAEEVLQNNLNETLWKFINDYPVAYKSEVMLKDWIINAMEEYAKLSQHSILVKPTDIEFIEWLGYNARKCNWIVNDSRWTFNIKDGIDTKSLEEVYTYWLTEVKSKV